MRNPTPYDLHKSAEHIAFEFYHFEMYGNLIRRRIAGEKFFHIAFYQAIGYQFLIHLRSLIDFFFLNGEKDDDLVASDFRILPGFDILFPQLTTPNWVGGVKKELNKRLAHLTAERWTSPSPSMFSYHRHLEEMCRAISLFRAALPADLRCQIESFEAEWARRDSDL